MLIECPRCEGDLHEPTRQRTEVCRRCGGRGTVEGRPDDWPPPGAILQSVESLDRFVVQDGDRFEMLKVRHEWSGAEMLIRPEELESKFTVDEEPE